MHQTRYAFGQRRYADHHQIAHNATGRVTTCLLMAQVDIKLFDLVLTANGTLFWTERVRHGIVGFNVPLDTL